jgi:exodeoxyribonuclease V alpha subunit
MPGVSIGSRIIIKGTEKEHEKFGPQINVSSYEFINPSAAERELMECQKFIKDLDIGPKTTSKILAIYKDHTKGILEKNPYQTIIDIPGIGFKTADKIAAKVGITGDNPRRIQECILHCLEKAAEDGHVYLPHGELIQKAFEFTECEYDMIESLTLELGEQYKDYWKRKKESRIVIEDLKEGGQIVYLRRLYQAEKGSLEHLNRLRALPARSFEQKHSLDESLRWFSGLSAAEDPQDTLNTGGINLTEEQKEAVKAALTQKILVITGGPGVGKTTIVKAIGKILRRENRPFALCAPTGRAARRLKETVGIEDSKTIHRLLGYNPRNESFTFNVENPLTADVIICDESSMLDIELANALLAAISDRTSIVFIGDADQLPPVGPGRFFRDLIASEIVKIVRLTHIFRQKQKESLIISGSRQILQQEMPVFGTDPNIHDLFQFTYKTQEEAVQMLIELVTEKIPQKFGISPDDIQILSPNKRETSFLSTSYLNKIFQEQMRGMNAPSKSIPYLVGDRVIQTRNNYTHFVMNGDIGVVERVVTSGVDIKWFGAENLVCRYSLADLWDVDLAYAITIHKAQGSEYPAVIVIGDILPSPPGFYNRNMLYTAVTRGKRLTIVFTSATKHHLGRILSYDETSRNSRLLDDLIDLRGRNEFSDKLAQVDFDEADGEKRIIDHDEAFGDGSIDFSKYEH